MSPAWFWTTEWQTGERAATEDIARGRTCLTKNVDAFFAELDDRDGAPTDT